MEAYFNQLIDSVLGNPHMLIVSFIMALDFGVGGIALYVKRDKLQGWRWPGVTCTLLCCDSLVPTTIHSLR